MDAFTFSAKVIRETEKGRLVEYTLQEVDPVGEGTIEWTEQSWLPKSGMTRISGDRWQVPMWLARRNGLVRGSLETRFSRYQQAL